MGTTATTSTAMETTAIAGVNTITIRPIPTPTTPWDPRPLDPGGRPTTLKRTQAFEVIDDTDLDGDSRD